MSNWFVYILCCADNTLYTGITTDPVRRVAEHNSSKRAARYTRVRRPLTLIYSESLPDRAAAAQREYAIKQLTREQKLALCAPAATD